MIGFRYIFLINFILDSNPKEIHIKHNKSQKRETIRQVSPNPNIHILKSVLISKCFIRTNSLFFLHISRGEHLAVLNTYDSFFICKTMQNIFAPAQKVPIKILLTFLEFANRYRSYVIRSRHVKP